MPEPDLELTELTWRASRFIEGFDTTGLNEARALLFNSFELTPPRRAVAYSSDDRVSYERGTTGTS
jgi:hypothetical protein